MWWIEKDSLLIITLEGSRLNTIQNRYYFILASKVGALLKIPYVITESLQSILQLCMMIQLILFYACSMYCFFFYTNVFWNQFNLPGNEVLLWFFSLVRFEDIYIYICVLNNCTLKHLCAFILCYMCISYWIVFKQVDTNSHVF